MIAQLLRDEYPHMKASSISRIAVTGKLSVAEQAKETFRDDCKGVRALVFMDLPRELRDRIYENVVAPSYKGETLSVGIDHAEAYNTGVSIEFFSQSKHEQPSITKVNRKIREETLPMFYEKNSFIVSTESVAFDLGIFSGTTGKPVDIFKRWLRAIGPDNVKHIRNLVVLARIDGLYGCAADPPVDYRAVLDEAGVKLHKDGRVTLVTHNMRSWSL